MKIQAFINEKDVSTDWIEMIFDNYSVVCNGNQAVGFVAESPVYAYWNPNDNAINWRAENSYIANVIRERLSSFESEERELFSECYTVGKIIIQRFYFKD